MRTKSKKSIINLYQLMTVLWAKCLTEELNPECIGIHKYLLQYHVTKFPRSMILPYLTQNKMPTWEQAVEFRKKLTLYSNSKMKAKQKQNAVSQDIFSVDSSDSEKNIENAIDLLKKNGYIIFKKV